MNLLGIEHTTFAPPIDISLAVLSRLAAPQNFTGAVSAVERIKDDEQDKGVSADEQTLLLSPGYRTSYTMLIFNGIGETPSTIRGGAEKVFELGWNVLVPRLPKHGGQGYFGSKKDLTVDDLLLCIEETVPIAAKLGDRLVVTGASLGSIMTAYAAVRFPTEIDEALIIQPPLSLKGVRDDLRPLVIELIRQFPDSEKLPILGRPAPGGSSHAMASGGELVLLLESILASNSVSDSLSLNVKYDEGDPIFGSNNGKRLVNLMGRSEDDLENWKFPFHVLESEGADWTTAYDAIFEELRRFAAQVQEERVSENFKEVITGSNL